MADLTFIGFIAGFLTTIGFAPQIIKGLRTRRMEDVSFTMPIILMIGMLLWIAYGFILDNFPIIMWNSVAAVLNLGIIALRLKYGHRDGCAPAS